MHRELPARLDLEWYRKQAKDLVRAFRAGAPEAIERVEGIPGERARERFGLSDAQWLLAREHGFGSWAELRRRIEVSRREPPATKLGAAFEAARAGLGDRGDVWLDAGLRYGGGESILVLVRKRPSGERGWFEFSDDARAVEAAGRPQGWLELARRVVRDLDLNVNRRGVVFVASPDWREDEWIHSLIDRIADASLAVYEALLELDE